MTTDKIIDLNKRRYSINLKASYRVREQASPEEQAARLCKVNAALEGIDLVKFLNEYSFWVDHLLNAVDPDDAEGWQATREIVECWSDVAGWLATFKQEGPFTEADAWSEAGLKAIEGIAEHLALSS